MKAKILYQVIKLVFNAETKETHQGVAKGPSSKEDAEKYARKMNRGLDLKDGVELVSYAAKPI